MPLPIWSDRHHWLTRTPPNRSGLCSAALSLPVWTRRYVWDVIKKNVRHGLYLINHDYALLLIALFFFSSSLDFSNPKFQLVTYSLKKLLKKIILVIVMIWKLLNWLRWWEQSPEEDTRVRAGATWAEWDSTGHQRVAGVEQDNLVLLKLEGRLEGGERIDHLVPAVEHIAVIQALPATCGKKIQKQSGRKGFLATKRSDLKECLVFPPVGTVMLVGTGQHLAHGTVGGMERMVM